MLLIQNQISTLELKRLLYTIKDLSPEICIRVRFLGEMWCTDFMRVAGLNDNEATFYDERNHRHILIPDLTYVMQFELDGQFQQYQPHFHYTVDGLSLE